MNILALDPAVSTGFALCHGEHFLHGVWNLGERRSEGQKLLCLAEHMRSVPRPDLVAFEAASFGASGRKGEGGPQWSTIAWHNKLRGVIEMVAFQLGARSVAFHPSTIKSFATDNGRASKQQMIAAVRRHFGIVVTSDDEADAIWVLELAKYPSCWPPTKQQKRAAKKRVKAKQPSLF